MTKTGLQEDAPESPKTLPELPPLNEALLKVVGEHLEKFLSMRAAYIRVISKPKKPNENERVEGWLSDPEEDPKRRAAYLNPPKPFLYRGKPYELEDLYTVKTADSGCEDPNIPVVGGEADADRWVTQTIAQIEKVILDDDMQKAYPNRISDHPLLMAVYHVLKIARGRGEGTITIPHDVCMNAAREYDDIYCGDVETGYIAEGDTLLEKILALGEEYKLVVDKRRPRLVKGVVQMGYKYSPVKLGLDVSAEVWANLTGRDPEEFFKLNKGGQTLRHGWNDDHPLETSYDWTHCI